MHTFSWQQLRGLQQQDKIVKAVACALMYDRVPDNQNLRRQVDKLLRFCYMFDGVVCCSVDKPESAEHVVLAPASTLPSILHLAHDSALGGHYGSAKTLMKISNKYFWPGMRQDIARHCQACLTCQRTNPEYNKKKAPLAPLQETTAFGSRVHIDLLGPLPLSRLHNNKYVLAMTDSFTGMLELVGLPNKTADVVAEQFLQTWIMKHGCPVLVVSDQGSEFTAAVFTSLLSKLHVQHIMSSTAHPQSNGQVERKNRVILSYLRKFLGGKQPLGGSSGSNCIQL